MSFFLQLEILFLNSILLLSKMDAYLPDATIVIVGISVCGLSILCLHVCHTPYKFFIIWEDTGKLKRKCRVF